MATTTTKTTATTVKSTTSSTMITTTTTTMTTTVLSVTLSVPRAHRGADVERSARASTTTGASRTTTSPTPTTMTTTTTTLAWRVTHQSRPTNWRWRAARCPKMSSDDARLRRIVQQGWPVSSEEKAGRSVGWLVVMFHCSIDGCLMICQSSRRRI